MFGDDSNRVFNPSQLANRRIVEKGLEQLSALATVYESEKITAEARQSRRVYGCTYSDDSDEADEYEDAVEDSNLVDLETGDTEGPVSSCPAVFL